MILPKEKINRYLRHIIMPEISGAGQKKIIGSKVFIYSPVVNEAAPLVYYLAASGVGHISCYFKDCRGFEDLYNNIHDLNEDVFLELFDKELFLSCSVFPYEEGSAVRILIGSYDSLKEDLIDFSGNQEYFRFFPIIAAFTDGWKGFVQVINSQEEFNRLYTNRFNLSSVTQTCKEVGSLLSSCLLGSLTAIECIKLCLDLGTIFNNPLSFELLSMQFNQLDTNENQIPADRKENSNTKKLSESKVLIVGTGGLGSSNVYALASVGLGTLGLVDFDKVEISNLNRQIVHSTSRIEMSKVESAKIFAQGINPNTKIISYNTNLNIHNAMDIIKEYDVIVDALDNFPDRYLLNDACYFAGKPLVEAAAVKTHGLIMTILPGKGPCYRCTFPPMLKLNGVMSCAESGVLGPVPGVMGFIQAAEVVKLLLDIGDLLSDRVIYYEALDSDFVAISINKLENCELCGTQPSITTLVEYRNSCEVGK